jgi:hypothetical protein
MIGLHPFANVPPCACNQSETCDGLGPSSLEACVEKQGSEPLAVSVPFYLGSPLTENGDGQVAVHVQSATDKGMQKCSRRPPRQPHKANCKPHFRCVLSRRGVIGRSSELQAPGPAFITTVPVGA